MANRYPMAAHVREVLCASLIDSTDEQMDRLERNAGCAIDINPVNSARWVKGYDEWLGQRAELLSQGTESRGREIDGSRVGQGNRTGH